VKDAGKSKAGKSKEPGEARVAEVLAAVAAELDDSGALPGAALAQLVKLQIVQDRQADLEARAAELARQAEAQAAAAAAAGDRPKTPKTPAKPKTPAGKKGKGEPAVGEDTPGKQPSALKKRSEAGVSTLDDEPAAGADRYYLLSGMADPSVLQALASMHTPVAAVVQLQATADQAPSPSAFKTAVRALAERTPAHSLLRSIGWCSVLVGEGGVFEPQPIFDAVAASLYSLQDQLHQFHLFQQHQTIVRLPDATVTPNLSVYTQFVGQKERKEKREEKE
jgi:hypothetical protein